jgi:antitoxin FitA
MRCGWISIALSLPMRGDAALKSSQSLIMVYSYGSQANPHPRPTHIAGQPTSMSSITIRNLDPAIKERLRIRAAEHGHSMEAEVRRILQTTLKTPDRQPQRNLYERIRARVEPIGGIDLELPPREPTRDPPRFD